MSIVHHISFIVILGVLTRFQAFSFFFSSKTGTPKVDETPTAIESLTSITGVPPHLVENYSSDTFKCDGNTKTISISEVNDEFCDCKDGSDEPGTNACHIGSFYCHNKGYKPLHLPASRVEDGICDCCDGSDETMGRRVTCYNTCDRMAAQQKEMLKGLQTIFNKGYEIRSQLINKIQTKLENDMKDPAAVQSEIQLKTASVEELESKEKTISDKNKEEEIQREEILITYFLDLTGFNKIATEHMPTLLKGFLAVTRPSEDDVKLILAGNGEAPEVSSDEVVNEEASHDEEDSYGHSESDESPRENTPSTRSCILGTEEEIQADSILNQICDHLPHQETSSPQALHTAVYEMTKNLILNLIQNNKYYNEAQLIFGKCMYTVCLPCHSNGQLL